MGLPRFILFAIIIGGGIWLWRRFTSRPNTPVQPSPVQTMVCCAHCHVHLPEDRAIQGDSNTWYCSSKHLKLGPKTRD
ncbi:MAG TPA: PP0621 family protein [Thiopseudomonas sp.]|nr:PP0621 family protein [Thiopseudomonas sp.]